MIARGPDNSAETRAHVLVVDDQEMNRSLLLEMLGADGYEVSLCAGGAEALAMIAVNPPDLVLLDITMPELDGLEVCRRLRANSATVSLPVIMVTALAHRQQQLEGIAAGANDYLTKPIDRANLSLRVRNATQMHRLHRQCAHQYERLRELEQLRDGLVHMLVHDLRSPMQGMTLGLEFVRERLCALKESQALADLDDIDLGMRVIMDLVNDVLDVSRFEDGAMPLEPATIDLLEVAREAVAVLGNTNGVDIVFAPTSGCVNAVADPGIVRRVIANLVGNACKFTKRGDRVLLRVQYHEGIAEFSVTDTGPGIAPEHQALIFEKFGQVKQAQFGAKYSSGLGLTFCKQAVEASGGDICVESVLGAGSTFRFTLPQPLHT